MNHFIVRVVAQDQMIFRRLVPHQQTAFRRGKIRQPLCNQRIGAGDDFEHVTAFKLAVHGENAGSQQTAPFFPERRHRAVIDHELPLDVRDRKGETTTMEVDEFIAKVTSEIKNRSL